MVSFTLAASAITHMRKIFRMLLVRKVVVTWKRQAALPSMSLSAGRGAAASRSTRSTAPTGSPRTCRTCEARIRWLASGWSCPWKTETLLVGYAR